jgi:transcription elongation factor GreA
MNNIDFQPNKFHVTKKGLEKIKKEYDKLLAFRIKKTKSEVPAIWHSEDVNPEYLAFQEDMSLLEARLTEYENILKNATIISIPPKSQQHIIGFGATITLEEHPGKTINEYTLLGTMEANPAEGKISADSPVGKQLLGKKIGEDVVISSPIRVVYKVKKIRYIAL